LGDCRCDRCDSRSLGLSTSSACTDELPDADAALAWKKLESIYAKKYTTKKGELKAEFFATALKTSPNDPDSWFTKLKLVMAKHKLDSYEFC